VNNLLNSDGFPITLLDSRFRGKDGMGIFMVMTEGVGLDIDSRISQ
jgi:hypothetical protein